jgi:uncharacterized protein (DUF1778 family)
MKSDVQLNLRAKESREHSSMLQRSFINREPTLLEMACKAAENVILDRRVFNFNDEQYAEFIDMLDAPVEDEPPLINYWQETSVGRITTPEPLSSSSAG